MKKFSRSAGSGEKKRRPLSTVLVGAVCVLCIAVLLVMYIYNKSHQARLSAELEVIAAQNLEEEELEEEAYDEYLEEIETDYSFYQKLEAGYDVNILVVGDLIGSGSGASSSDTRWYNLLADYLEEEYMDGTEIDGDIVVTTATITGGTAYSGYVRIAGLDDGTDYDLVILCCAQNDTEETFARYYEALIRMALTKYEGCSVIAILESEQLNYMDITYMDDTSTNELSEDAYTEKLTTINTLCSYYDIPVADMAAAFVDSGYAYDELTDDGTYPNDTGQEIYFNTIAAVIAENVQAQTGKSEIIDAYGEEAAALDSYSWYAAGNTLSDGTTEFLRSDETTYTLSVSASGMLGIDFTCDSGTDNVSVYIDGTLYKTVSVTNDSDSSARVIRIVGENVDVDEEISIVFESSDQADGFYGICFCGE